MIKYSQGEIIFDLLDLGAIGRTGIEVNLDNFFKDNMDNSGFIEEKILRKKIIVIAQEEDTGFILQFIMNLLSDDKTVLIGGINYVDADDNMYSYTCFIDPLSKKVSIVYKNTLLN